MSAIAIESPAARLLMRPESDYHLTLQDLNAATMALELVAGCEEVPADLRRMTGTAFLRLFDAAERLKRWKHSEARARNQSATIPLSPAD